MAVKNKTKNKSHVCKFCKVGFSSAMILSSHLCKKKMRYADRNTIGSRMGFRVFQLFYKKTTYSKSPKTIEEFIDSKFYLDFVKFGKYYTDLNPIHKEQFINFLIDNSIKMSQWMREEVYETYVEGIIYKEAPSNAVERSITTLVKWSEESGLPYYDFFRSATPSEIAYYIKTGKISPWAMYLCSSGVKSLSRLSPEQVNMIKNIIDPDRWKAKLIKNKSDSSFFKKLLGESGL